MKILFLKSFLSIALIFVLIFTATISLAGEEKAQNRALEYIEKLEAMIIEVVPEGQKEQVKKLFKELKEFLKKEWGSEKESEPTEETIWKRKIKPVAT